MPDEMQQRWGADAHSFAKSLLDAQKAAPDFLTSKAGINDPLRFAVYKNNVTVSLVRALEANFPAIVRLVGGDYFMALARVFVEMHPPKSRILAQYGERFPEFLKDFEPLAQYPYLCDVAQLEQFWREAFHEEDKAPLTAEQLAVVQSNDTSFLSFKAHPATRLLKSNFAAGSILAANRSEGNTQPIDPAKPEFALITRPHFDCSLRILDSATGTFVAQLLLGKTLGYAAQFALATNDEFDLASSIQGILACGAFCEFMIESNSEETTLNEQ